MSSKFAIIPADAIFDERVSHAQLRTLIVLCYYGAQKNGGCWPSYSTIASELGITRRVVIDYIKHLCDCGYVVKNPRDRQDGGNSSNLYRVSFDLDLIVEKGVSADAKIKGWQDKDHTPKSSTPSATEQPPPRCQPAAPASATEQHQLYMNSKIEQEKKEKNNKKVTLSEWEQNLGVQLCIQQIAQWVKSEKLDALKVKRLISEYRDAVTAGGNKYADHAAAFKVWLRKGYLSIGIEQAREKISGKVILAEKGLSI